MNMNFIKNAIMTTAIVLGTIYILNRTPAKTFVKQAING